jgi:dolichol-phosphate mannosyltransferase
LLVSIVSPIYNEAECLPLFRERLAAVLEGIGCPYEVVLVNDGSNDATAGLIDSYHHTDSRWRGLHLARNFGHQAAITAGLDAARGDAVIVMDSDLQDAPEAIPALLEKWREGYQVVYAIRTDRKEAAWKRAAYKTFYRLLSAISDTPIPVDSGDFSLMDRAVVEALKGLPERRRFVRGLRSWVGFKQIGIPIERGARIAGEVKYSRKKLFGLASDGLFSFSWIPLRLLTLSGVAAVLVSLVYLAVIVVLRLLGTFDVPGWTTVVFLLVCFGGMQLLGLGLVGEYVGRMYDEVKGRPVYLVASRSGDGPTEDETHSRSGE